MTTDAALPPPASRLRRRAARRCAPRSPPRTGAPSPRPCRRCSPRRACRAAQAAAARSALARRLAQTLRERKTAAGRDGLVQGLLQEYSLSSQEGVALMCLAEALLRIPDTATRDALIRDKISNGHWHEHLGRSPSLFVNAATWGAAAHRQAGRDAQRVGPVERAGAADRQGRRAADPQGRRPGDAPDGRAVRHRRDDRRGARQRAAARGAGLSLFVRHARRGGAHRGRRGALPRAPTRTRSTRSAAPRPAAASTTVRASRSSSRRCTRATAGRRSSASTAELYPVLKRARAARAQLRHRPQHRRRGSRPPRALARPARAPVLRARSSPAGTASASSSRRTRSAARS